MRPRIYYALPLSLLVAALLLLASPGEVMAQQQKSGENDLNLPAWSQSNQSSRVQQRQQPRQQQQQQEAPDLPGGPDQVPVDGGLGLLAAAGAAYAVSRLRRKDEDGDEEQRDALP